MPKSEKPSSLKFQEVTELIVKEIKKLPQGSPVPSTTFWREKLKVSRTTINRAFLELKSLGLVSTKIGSGTVTSEKARVRTVLVFWEKNRYRSHSLYGAEFLTGASMACEKIGDVLVAHLQASEITDAWNPRHLYPSICGAIFFRSKPLCEKISPLLEAQEIPWCHYGSSAYALSSHGIAVDEATVVKVAMEELVAKGHRKIGMMFREGHPPGEERFKQWMVWCLKNKLPFQESFVWKDGDDDTLEKKYKFKKWLDQFTAVFCATDSEAVKIMEIGRPL